MTNLVESHVGTVPSGKQDRRVGAVSSEPAGRAPVGAASHAVPRLVRQPVDAGNLVVGPDIVLVEPLKVLEAQNVKVELVGKVTLQIPDLASKGDGACRSQGLATSEKEPEQRIRLTSLTLSGGNTGNGNVATHD